MWIKRKNIQTNIKIEDIEIEITQKAIRSMRISIRPPQAQVKVSAPFQISLAKIEQFILSRIDWIKENQEKIKKSKYRTPQKIIDGEIHELFGKKFTLKITKEDLPSKCFIDKNEIKIQSKKYLNFEKRQKLLDGFYREKLKEAIPGQIAQMEKVMNVKVAEFGIKKMKTRWGTCNPAAKRIWINLELAKYPDSCLLYLITHEMTHFFEKHHNKRFFSLMDQFLPEWKKAKENLNSLARI